MTPYELNIYAQTYSEKQQEEMQEEMKEKITLAYLNSMWTIQWLGKRHQQPKPLKEILKNIGREKKRMTDEQMFNQVKVLNAVFGGEVKRPSNSGVNQ